MQRVPYQVVIARRLVVLVFHLGICRRLSLVTTFHAHDASDSMNAGYPSHYPHYKNNRAMRYHDTWITFTASPSPGTAAAARRAASCPSPTPARPAPLYNPASLPRCTPVLSRSFPPTTLPFRLSNRPSPLPTPRCHTACSSAVPSIATMVSTNHSGFLI